MGRGENFWTDPTAEPYTHLEFGDDRGEFRFAVISDNAGGARAGVFAKAVDMVNLLHADFVVSVGDFIEGYNDDEDQIRAWWQEIDEALDGLDAPFFFVPGNHDYYSDASVRVWGERFGDDRGYSHFVYDDVLFLLINTQDPPLSIAEIQRDDPEAAQRLLANMTDLGRRQAEGGLTLDDARTVDELAEHAGVIKISDEQVEYFRQVVDDNRDARWAFCLTHAPPYYSPISDGKDPGRFAQIEAVLGDIPYTVLSGHTHVYNYEQRNGQDFVTTATSGGISFERPGAMDHIVWITMTREGPKIANLLMNGVMDKAGPPTGNVLHTGALYRP